MSQPQRDTDALESSGEAVRVNPRRIRRFEGQPRRRFQQAALERLGLSMKTAGQKAPILVKRIEGDPDHDYELIDGERRWRAALLVGLRSLKAVVEAPADPDQQFEDSLIANFNREDHTPLEIALGIKRLIDRGLTQTEVAERLSRSQPVINSYLRLLDLHPTLQAALEEEDDEGRLPIVAAQAFVKLAPSAQLGAWAEFSRGRRTVQRANTVVNRALASGAPMHENSRVRRKTGRDFVRQLLAYLEKGSDLLIEMEGVKWASTLAAMQPRYRLQLQQAAQQFARAFEPVREQVCTSHGPKT